MLRKIIKAIGKTKERWWCQENSEYLYIDESAELWVYSIKKAYNAPSLFKLSFYNSKVNRNDQIIISK